MHMHAHACRFCQYPEGHLVFESSQTMADIPYGDCFTVDLRWDVRPQEGGSGASAGFAQQVGVCLCVLNATVPLLWWFTVDLRWDVWALEGGSGTGAGFAQQVCAWVVPNNH